MAKPNEDQEARVKLKFLNKSSKPTINTVSTELYVNLHLPLIRYTLVSVTKFLNSLMTQNLLLELKIVMGHLNCKEILINYLTGLTNGKCSLMLRNV